MEAVGGSLKKRVSSLIIQKHNAFHWNEVVLNSKIRTIMRLSLFFCVLFCVVLFARLIPVERQVIVQVLGDCLSDADLCAHTP